MDATDPRFEVIDSLAGTEFELALVELFEMLGYDDVTHIGGYDKGADITFVREGKRIAVQAKRQSKAVPLIAARQLIDGIRRYDCAGGLLVTNNYFTEQAVECATEWDIELWDRRVLAEFLDGEAPEIDSTVCAICGAQVTAGITKWCLDHPARYGGAVFCLKHQSSKNR